MGECRLIEEMKRAVECLQLERKIVFVERSARIFLAATRDGSNSSVARIQIFVRIHNRVADHIRRVLGSVIRKIRANEAALSVNHMAFGAASFPEEKRGSFFSITGHRLSRYF